MIALLCSSHEIPLHGSPQLRERPGWPRLSIWRVTGLKSFPIRWAAHLAALPTICAWYGMCMYSERTQVLLSPEQLERLKRLARRDGRSVGAVIRDAVDAYTLHTSDRHAAIERLLSLEAPVDDWEVMKAEILRGALGEG